MKELKLNDWMSIDGEAYREYVYPDGIYRIEQPLKVNIKRSERGDSHRVVSAGPVSHYVRPGWLAIRWEGKDGQEQFDW